LHCELGFNLPAVAASTEVTLTTAAATTAIAAAATAAAPVGALAPLCGTSFVDNQCTAHKLPAIARLNGLVSRIVVIYFYKSEPTRFAAETVTHDVHAINLHTGICEEAFQVAFCRFVGQIPYE
jgi:hypothetical protein